jgi:CubicO group peptidase (beta-lactamase class C family)
MKKLLFIPLLIALYLFTNNASSNNKQLDKIVTKTTLSFLTENNYSGLQVVVLDKGDLLYEKGFGYADIKNQIKFSKDTVVALGSNAKVFTSTAIQLLRNRGLLKLDEQVEKYLPYKALQNSKVTIRQLLCHTSGLADVYGSDEPFDARFSSLNSFVTQIDDMPKLAAAGEQYEYNNGGYLLLAILVEELSQQSIGDFYRENIIAPLQLTNTYYLGDTFQPMNMAKAYDDKYGQLILFTPEHENYTEYRIAHGAGGIGGSVSDYAKWHRAILKGKLIPAKNTEEMTQYCSLNDGTKTNYGLGMQTGTFNNENYFYHGGASNGFGSDAVYFPKRDLTIAFAGNTWKNPNEYKKQLISDILTWLDKR